MPKPLPLTLRKLINEVLTRTNASPPLKARDWAGLCGLRLRHQSGATPHIEGEYLCYDRAMGSPDRQQRALGLVVCKFLLRWGGRAVTQIDVRVLMRELMGVEFLAAAAA